MGYVLRWHEQISKLYLLKVLSKHLTFDQINLFQVDFPAVTICSPGMNEDILTAGFLKQFFAYLLLNRVNMTISPFRAARILSKELILLSSFSAYLF